jgi:hypothetical protein
MRRRSEKSIERLGSITVGKTALERIASLAFSRLVEKH